METTYAVVKESEKDEDKVISITKTEVVENTVTYSIADIDQQLIDLTAQLASIQAQIDEKTALRGTLIAQLSLKPYEKKEVVPVEEIVL